MLSLLKRLILAQEEPASAIPEEELNAHIDMAVKQFDSRLSIIPGYRRKLRRPVETALLCLESLIDLVPGPIEISNRAYGADPRVHAYFGALEQIEHLFSHSRDFRKFMELPASHGLSHGHALMVMTRQEKRRLGHALNGDHVHSDVMQEVVVFSGHHLVSPCASQQETRRQLRQREFSHLVAEAAKAVARQTQQKTDLQRQKAHLKIELKACLAERDSVDFKLDKPGDNEPACATLAQQLSDAEKGIGITSRSLGTIEDYLGLLIEVLGNPSDHCSLTVSSDCLSRANVRVDTDSGKEIPYAKISIGETQHYWVLVKYPFNEMAEQSSIANLVEKVYGN